VTTDHATRRPGQSNGPGCTSGPAQTATVGAMADGMAERVDQAIRARIADGTYGPGDRLPSRAALAAELDVAPFTVTSALHRLRGEGLVSVVPRGGWYVRRERAVVYSRRARLSRAERAEGRGTFSSDCYAAGLTPDVSTVVDVEPATDDVAGELGISPGDDVLARHRVMRADGDVLQLATSYLPRSITDGTAIELDNPGPGGIYRRLDELGHTLTSYVERVSVGRADEHEGPALGLSVGDPVLRVQRTAYAGERAVEVNRITITPDRYVLVYELPAD
jgi:GntR family transcriptional regulator